MFLESQALSSIALSNVKQPPSGTRLHLLFIRTFPLSPLLISSHHIWDIVLSGSSFLLFYQYCFFFFSSHMTALDAAPPPANMLRRFFNSCFNKRPESTPPHLQGSNETDSSDATLVPPHSPPHSSGLTIQDRMRATGKGKAVLEARSPAANTPTMPKAVKEKKAAKSTKDRKPYSKAARSDPTSLNVYSRTLFSMFILAWDGLES